MNQQQPKKISHPFDINDHNIAYVPIDSSENLFGIDINDGYKFTNDVNGNYNYFDSDKNLIFQHQEHLNFDLYSELQPEQARALVEQYGYPEAVVMEQADTDDDGALDKVAVRCVGEGGKGFTHEAKYIEGESIIGYIADKIFFDTNWEHI